MNKVSFGYYIYSFVKGINKKIQKTYSLLKLKVYSLRAVYIYIYISPRKNTFSASDDF